MKKLSKNTFHLIYGIATGVIIAVAAVCLIVACVGIYKSGDSPYTRESVAEAFAGIAVPVYACLALVIGGFIIELVIPSEKKKVRHEKNYSLILNRLRASVDLTKCDAELQSSVKTQRFTVRLHKITSAVLLVVASIVFLLYATDSGNFHQTEINSSVIKAVSLMGACLVIPFSYAVFTAFYTKKSMQIEIELLKQAKNCEAAVVSIDGRLQDENKKICCLKKDTTLIIIKCAVIAAAVAVLVYGFVSGGTVDVLTKAVNICTECIGLG